MYMKSLKWSHLTLFLMLGTTVALLSDRVTIRREYIKDGIEIVSLNPPSYINGVNMDSMIDVLYLTPIVSRNNTICDIEDDEHFCSRLCDSGFKIHTFTFKRVIDANTLDVQIREFFTKYSSPRSVVLMGLESSCISVIDFLTSDILSGYEGGHYHDGMKQKTNNFIIP